MNFNKLYDEYKKEVETQSSGLVTGNKADFLKFCVFYDLVQREEKRLIKQSMQNKLNFKNEYDSYFTGKSDNQ